MGEKKKITRFVRPAAEMAAASAVGALASVAVITARNHRELTHRSIILHPWLAAMADAEQRSYGVGEPKVWAAVHRIHHSVPDATLYPFYAISRAISWAESHPEKSAGVTIPDSFPNLDPYVDTFSRADVMEIGKEATQLIRRRLKGAYEEPAAYSKGELEKILNPQAPQYYYPSKKHKGAYSQEEVAQILLGDPHSPVRIPPPEKNGVRGILKKNVPLYTHHADMFRARPELKEDDLQNEDGGNRKAKKKDIALGILIPSALVLLRRHKFAPKDFAIALAAGSAIYGAKIGLVLAGGNAVNSLGHAGELTQKTLVNAVQKNIFKPHPNEDGTVSTDTSEAGPLGWFLGVITLDEVGGQEAHHSYPEDIAYTRKLGAPPKSKLRAWWDAPWGMFLYTLAHSKHAPFIKPGFGFQLQPGEKRPDEPMHAMDIIHRRRAEQLQQREGKN